MRSALLKPHSSAMVSTGRTVCSSLQRAASARARSVNCAGESSGFASKEPREIARAHGHAIRQGGDTEIRCRVPQDPDLKFTDVWPALLFQTIQIRAELGLPSGASGKNHHNAGDSEHDFPAQVFFD